MRKKYKIECQHQWESWEAFSFRFRNPYKFLTHLNFDLNKCKPTKGEKNHFQIFWHANMCFKCVIAFEKIIAWSAKKSFQLGIFFISGLSKSLVIITYNGTWEFCMKRSIFVKAFCKRNVRMCQPLIRNLSFVFWGSFFERGEEMGVSCVSPSQSNLSKVQTNPSVRTAYHPQVFPSSILKENHQFLENTYVLLLNWKCSLYHLMMIKTEIGK